MLVNDLTAAGIKLVILLLIIVMSFREICTKIVIAFQVPDPA